MTNERYAGHKWLCEAFGETDLPCACICADHAEVEQFLIREWLGDPEDPLLPELMEELDNHDWDEGEMSWTFEIGGVTIKRVFESGPTDQAKANLGVVAEPVAWCKSSDWNDAKTKRQSFSGWRQKHDDCDMEIIVRASPATT